MKRIFLFCLFIASASFIGKAQEVEGDALAVPTRIALGIKVGMNLSQLNGDTWESGYKTNALGGIFLGVHNKKIGVTIEGLFSQSSYVTGKKFNQLDSIYFAGAKDSLKQGTFRVNYLNIPLLFDLKILNRVWFQVGPQYSGVVGVKDVDGMLKDAKKLFGNGDLSGVVGLHITMPAHLTIEGRYIFGLTDMKASSVNVSEKWNQRVIQVSIGYNFL